MPDVNLLKEFISDQVGNSSYNISIDDLSQGKFTVGNMPYVDAYLLQDNLKSNPCFSRIRFYRNKKSYSSKEDLYCVSGFVDISNYNESFSSYSDCDDSINSMYESSVNELAQRAQKHKRTDTKGARGWFYPNKGNPETMSKFNNSVSSDASFSGGGESAGMGESLLRESDNDDDFTYQDVDNNDKQQLISYLKELGYNYKFEKYTAQQLYNMLQWARKKKREEEMEYYGHQDELYRQKHPKQSMQREGDYLAASYKNHDIFYSPDTKKFYIDDYNMEFENDDSAIDYLKERERKR